MSRARKLAAAIVVVVLLRKKRRNRKKRLWVRNWVARRPYRGCVANLVMELKNEDPNTYKNFLRMTADDFNYLLEKVAPKITKQNTNMREAIPASDRLALTLRFLASGDSYQSLFYLFRIPPCTISKIIPECCSAIYEVLRGCYLKMPNTNEEWLERAVSFQEDWNFPNCIGALDGKHIVIKAPKNSGSYYFNYKGTHSIVLMALVGPKYEFIYIDVGCNGRISDGGVFSRCSLSSALEGNTVNIPVPRPLPGREKPMPFVIVADDAFAMRHYIMKPYPFKNQPGPNRIFNYRLSRARRIVENSFGLISARFRILRRPIELCPAKTTIIVSAICALHNFLLQRKSRIYAPRGTFDTETSDGTVVPGTWRTEQNHNANIFPLESSMNRNNSISNKQIREEFTAYFVSERGEVPWQYRYIT